MTLMFIAGFLCTAGIAALIVGLYQLFGGNYEC